MEYSKEPIAIIGMSCRLPGGAASPEQLWDKLANGVSTWSPAPKERFNLDCFHDPANTHATTTNTAGAHFLTQDIKTFDAQFFNIHPTEANAVDPQQRFMLELAYEAFESAGLPLSTLRGSNTGVYIGQWNSDYAEILARDPEFPALYHTVGAGPAITSNRVSYFFDLKGPSFTVDTGCSASLVALNSAVQSLRLGETDMALVGGVNLLLDPQRFAYQSKLKMFSVEGKSFSFDHRANGYGRGEGCCAIVLKPLSRALRDKDNIRALIRNSTVNQDGRTAGITVPSGLAQEKAITAAYSAVNIPLQADYVEAHGTGTAVGDPIEVAAIAAVLSGKGVDHGKPLPIGSIKGNIGHTESCAGLAGLVKAVLMLEKDLIPPQVNFEKPNEKLLLREWNLRIPVELERRHLSRISINSFGYGGTNAHVILEKGPRRRVAASTDGSVAVESGDGDAHYPNVTNGVTNGVINSVPKYPVNGANGTSKANESNHVDERDSTNATNGIKSHPYTNGTSLTNGTRGAQKLFSTSRATRVRAFLITGSTDQSCGNVATRFAEYINAAKATASTHWLDRLAYTMSKRTMHEKVAIVTAESAKQLYAKVKALSLVRTFSSGPLRGSQRSLKFVFTGQGAQYYNMGRELIGTWPAFTESLARSNQVLRTLECEWDLFTELGRNQRDTKVNSPGRGQPLTTAVQIALVDVLETLGVKPSYVIGHSSGEVAAAYAAGILSLKDAIRVSYHRGRLTDSLIGDLGSSGAEVGGMLAVGKPPSVVVSYIQSLAPADRERVAIACFNSPSSVTVSGNSRVIDALAEMLEEDLIFNRKLRTNGAAYHSHYMRSISRDYFESMQGIAPRKGSSVQMISSVTGRNVGTAVLDRTYWVENLVSPVRFTEALAALEATQGGGLLVEVGPHAALKGPIEQTLQSLKSDIKDHVSYVNTLKRAYNAEASMLECLGQLFVAGYEVDLHLANNGFLEELPPPLVDLPPYAFDHTMQYWHESRLSKDFRHRLFLPHEIIGNPVADFNTLEPRWRRFLRLSDVPWLRGHRVQGEVVFPAAGFLAMGLEAIRRLKLMQNKAAIFDSFQFRDISIGKALLITDDKANLEVSVSLKPETLTTKASSDQWMEFKVFSIAESQNWTEHCRGRIQAAVSPVGRQSMALAQFAKRAQAKAPEVRRNIRTSKFYHLWQEAGLDWQDAFASFVDIKAGPRSCLTTAKVPSIKALNDSVSNAQDTYLMHPAILDSCLFHGLCAMLLFEDKVDTAIVPTFIKHLDVSGHVNSVAGSTLHCETARAVEHQTFDVTVRQTDTDGATRPIVLRAEGISTAKLPGEPSVGGSNNRQMHHKVSQVTYCNSISRKHLRAVCRKGLQDATALERNRQLNSSALRFIKDAIANTTPDQAREPSRHLWYDWMQEVAKRSPDAKLNDQHTVDLGVFGETIERLGPRLHRFLDGTTDPLYFLTQDDLLPQLYQEERCARCYHQICQFVTELGFQTPGLKVLEIGGGTASASLPILSSAQFQGRNLIAKYNFTDISTGFFETAKARLADFSSVVSYGALDIERDVVSQGFEEGTYDVVVACNVIHATRSIGDSVGNAKKLLRPGGTLILMEITQDQVYYGLIFGAFAGWWAGASEGRKLSPLLTRDAWARKLEEMEFEATEAHFTDYDHGQGDTLSVFLARVPDVQYEIPTLPITFFHCEEDQSWVTRLSAEIGAQMETKQKIHVRPISARSDEGGLLIFPPGLSRRLATQISPDDWNTFTNQILCARACLFLTKGSVGNVSDPWGGLLTGFLRCLRLEHPELKLISLDLDQGLDNVAPDQTAKLVVTVLQSHSFDASADLSTIETEFSERDGQLFVTRVLHDHKLDSELRPASSESEATLTSFFGSHRHLEAELATPGLLQTIRWRDSTSEASLLGPDEVKLQLHAASINFKDVLIASGQLEGVTEMRNDCSGVVLAVGSNVSSSRFKAGDRACAYFSQSYNNYPIVPADCCALIPDTMGFEEAASLPIVWGTVYYSLTDKANLQKGDSILIHSGAGAVGQAAIQLAQHIGAEIFVTAGSEEKQRFISEKNSVPRDHIFSSRDTHFARALRNITSGRGVDVILNSLSGEMFRESCNTIAKFGRFVEIGRKDFLDNVLMPSKFLLDNVTFALVDLAQIISLNTGLSKRILEDVVKLMSRGVVKAIPITTMPISEIETAFRAIQAGKHIGKVVLTVENNQMVKALAPPVPTARLRPDGVYLVAGGFGGLGRTIVQWLASRGARKVLITSRSPINADKQDFLDDMMSRHGVLVLAKTCDIAKWNDVQDMLASVVSEGPILGLIQSTMALQDCILDDMSHSQWSAALGPKISGTWNLHNALPKELDFFISLSSTVAIGGNFGQSNYAGACSFQDAFAQYRRLLGLSAYSINVGAVLEAGFVSENRDVALMLRRHGLGTITTSELLDLLNHAITNPHNSPQDSQRSIGLLPNGTETGLRQAKWLSEARFSHLLYQETSSADMKNSKSGSFNAMDALMDAQSEDQARQVICYAVIHQLSKLIAAPVENMSVCQSLSHFGVDSLIAVELRNWIATYLQASVPLLVIRESHSFEHLADLVFQESRAVQTWKSSRVTGGTGGTAFS